MANKSKKQRSAKRRGSGEGTVFQAPDGKWVGFLSLGFREDGRRHRKKITGATEREVKDKILDARHDHEHGFNVAPARMTVACFLDSWLESVRGDVRPTTLQSYDSLTRQHLKPGLGKRILADLRAEHVLQFKQGKLAAGLSPRTVQYCLALLRMALGQAVKLDLVKRNVAQLVDYPKVEDKPSETLTPQQARILLESIKGHDQEALFSVGLALGLRKGEFLGLRWRDIDLEGRCLTVNHALQRIVVDPKAPKGQRSQLRLVEPKTKRSRRTISLPNVIVSQLVAHRERQNAARAFAGERWQETDYVFTSSIGTPIDPRNINDVFTDALVGAKLPSIRLHDLRHTCASLLLAQGVHPRVVMDLLGHSQIALTMNTYSHVIPDLRREAADQMDSILTPSKPDEPLEVAKVTGTRPS